MIINNSRTLPSYQQYQTHISASTPKIKPKNPSKIAIKIINNRSTITVIIKADKSEVKMERPRVCISGDKEGVIPKAMTSSRAKHR